MRDMWNEMDHEVIVYDELCGRDENGSYFYDELIIDPVTGEHIDPENRMNVWS